MPNEFDLQPNFANPGYATPEQLQQQRNYANMLQAASIAPTSTSWTGALAQALMGLSGATQANRANVLQQQALGRAGQSLSNIPLAPNQPSNIPGQPSQSYPPTSKNETVGVASNTSQNELSPYASAIASIESGGRYNEVGPVTRTGDRAVGKYQVMARDVPQRTQKYLGVAMTPQEFLNNPQAQEKEFAAEFGELAQKYGPSGAARAWFAGEGGMNNPHASDGYMTVAQYENRFNNAMRAKGNVVNPQAYGNVMVDPWVPESAKKVITESVTPREVGKDPYGRPIFAAPIGGGAQAPVGYTPGLAAPVSVPGVSGTTILSPQGMGGPAQSFEKQMQPYVEYGKSVTAQTAASGAQAKEIDADMQRAFIAPQAKQILATMKDDIQAHGKNVVWGTTSDFVNNVKRALLQHAPGFLTEEQAKGVASADSLEKLSAQLQTIFGGTGSQTDARLVQAIRSTPGLHNSMQGALALIDMLGQTTDLSSRFMRQAYPKINQSGYNHLEEKTRFFKENRITNPLTGNPVGSDLPPDQAPTQGTRGGGWSIIRRQNM